MCISVSLHACTLYAYLVSKKAKRGCQMFVRIHVFLYNTHLTHTHTPYTDRDHKLVVGAIAQATREAREGLLESRSPGYHGKTPPLIN